MKPLSIIAAAALAIGATMAAPTSAEARTFVSIGIGGGPGYYGGYYGPPRFGGYYGPRWRGYYGGYYGPRYRGGWDRGYRGWDRRWDRPRYRGWDRPRRWRNRW